MKVKKISLWRKVSQILFFILLVYGGYLFKTEWGRESFLPRISPRADMPRTAIFPKGSILWPSGDVPVVETYPPAATCRFNPNGGLFKACIFHFLSENLTWQTPIRYLLPHLALFFLLAFLLGRWWCGWVCPLGTVGDLLSALRRRLGLDYRDFTPRFQGTLRGMKYGLVTSSLTISWLIGMPKFKPFQCYLFLPYCQFCPARLLCPLFGGIVPSWRDFANRITTFFTLMSWVFLSFFLLVFFFGRRIWCYICPIGFFISFFNRGAVLELHKEGLRCNKCGICANSCPMGNKYVYEEKNKRIVNHRDCIFCLRCLELCPKDGCLKLKFFGREIIGEKRF